MAQALDDETTDFLTVPAGSFIIDIGQPAPSVGSGLKPYGLAFDLIITQQVPLWWVINPAKGKDGVDFSFDGKDYMGAPLIIPANFVDADVLNLIAIWQAKGVVVDGPTATDIANVPVYDILTSFPNIVLDLQNGSIAAAYLENAEIPDSFYRRGLPSDLTACDDAYAMPHADPAWSSHQNLLPFNNQGGGIWAACHAVSVLENVVNPDNASERLNFLTTDGAVPFGKHDDGSIPPPYVYQNPEHPIMQFIGVMDGAAQNGSEQIYLPDLNSTWRPATGIGALDDSHADVPGLSPGEAVVIAYGRGFGNPANGWVMYEGGHNHNNGTDPELVAAQRAFLNFLLLVGIGGRPEIGATIPSSIESGASVSLNAAITGGAPDYSYNWSNTCGGSFDNPNAANPTYTGPVATLDTSCIVRVAIADSCTRSNFAARVIIIVGKPNLSITTAESQDPVPTGENFSYILTVTNAGSDASNVQIVNTLPGSVGFVSALGAGWSCGEPSGVVTCDLAALANGDAASVTLTVTAPATTATLSNTATVSAVEGDLDLSDNTVTTTTRVLESTDLDLVSLTANPTSVAIGDGVAYTLTVRNNGPVDATTVVMSDQLPSGVSFVSAAGSGWNCGHAAATNVVTCILPFLAASATAPGVTILADAISSGTQLNTATVASEDFADADLSNNDQSVSVDVIANADLSIYTTTDTSDASNGNTVLFTLTLTNAGPDVANNVVVTDALRFSGDENNAVGFERFYDIHTYTFTFPDGTVIDGDGTRTYTQGGVTIAVDYSPVTTGLPDDQDPTPFPADGTPVDITWTITPGLASGATVTLTFEARKVGDGAAINTASVTADEPDPDTSNNTDSISLQRNVSESDLAIDQTAPPTVDPSTAFSYTFSVKNNGPERLDRGSAPDFTKITITATLPAGVSFDGFSQLLTATPIPPDTSASINDGTWSCGFSAPILTCNYTLDQGDDLDRDRYTADLQINVTAPSTSGDLVNSAAVSFSGPAVDGLRIDNTHVNSINSATTRVTPPKVDLALSKAVDNNTPSLGDTVTFTVTVTNNNATFSNAATNVSIDDALPAGVILVSAVPSRGSFINGAWLVGDLPFNDSATLTVQAQVDTTAAVTSTATLSGLDQEDADPANNTASASLDVPDADLAIVKTVNDATPNFGDSVTFTISLTNNGPDSTVVDVLDQIAPGLEIDAPGTDVVAGTGTATYDSATRQVAWNVGALATSSTATLTVIARVDAITSLVNTAKINRADLPDPNPGNDASTVTLDVQAADLAISNVITSLVVDNGRPGEPDPGDQVAFTLTLTNRGPSNAAGIQVIEVLPAGLNHLANTPSQGAYTSASGTWDVGALASNASATLVIVADILQFGTLPTTSSITASDVPDPNLNNNSASASVLSGGTADLFVTKSVDQAEQRVDANVTFTINLDNFGPDGATNAVVSDLLPTGLSHVGNVPSVGTYTPATGEWAIPSLAANTDATLTITAQITQAGTLINLVTVVGADQGDGDLIGNAATATVSGRLEADLELSLAVDSSNPIEGDPVTFTVTVTNQGPHDATNVEVIDILPTGLTFDTATPSQGSYTSGSGVWDIGALPAAAGSNTATLTLVATTDPGISGQTLTNTAEVTAEDEDDPDSSPGNGVLSEDDQDAVSLTVQASLDYGDAPAPYLTLRADDGARHAIDSNLFLGLVPPDRDSDAHGDGADANGDATDDDREGSNDEGGIGFAFLTIDTTAYSVFLPVFNNTGVDATLVAWIDFDGSGSFDADEAATVLDAGVDGIPDTVIPSSSISQTVQLTWDSIPGDISAGTTYVRFRLSTDVLTASDALGAASDGEVEEYAVTIAAASAVLTCNATTTLSRTDLFALIPPAGTTSVTYPVGTGGGRLSMTLTQTSLSVNASLIAGIDPGLPEAVASGVWLGNSFGPGGTPDAVRNESYDIVFSEPVTSVTLAFAALHNSVDGIEVVTGLQTFNGVSDVTASTTYGFIDASTGLDSGALLFDPLTRTISGDRHVPSQTGTGTCCDTNGQITIRNVAGFDKITFSRTDMDNSPDANNTDGVTLGPIDYCPVPAIRIADVSLTEGDSGTTAFDFTVSLDTSSASAVDVDFTTTNDSATSGDDYTATNGTLTIAAGDTSATITVDVTGDTLVEGNETFTVDLSNATDAVLVDAQATGSIENDDTATLRITDVAVDEGDGGTTAFVFTVTADPSDSAITVDFTTANGTAVAGIDYTAASGTVTIAAGDTSATITVDITGETLVESDETFTVDLSNPTGAVLGEAQGMGTIQNDDTATLRITDVAVDEGDSGTTAFVFTVTTTNPSDSAITVDVITADGTAVAGVDYTATSGTVTIAAGDTSTTITVDVTGETIVESDETFTVDLSNPTGAGLGDAQGMGTIQNDDVATLSLTDVSRAEGDSGTTAFDFTVSLDNPSTMAITVDFATTDGTATAGQDYAATTGAITIPAGDTSATITVDVTGDTLVEGDETFTVDLNTPTGAVLGDAQGLGTIQNDDTATLRITDVAADEGDSGATAFVFTVTTANPSDSAITVDFTTTAGTATAGTDYAATSGMATIPAGDTSATITVDVTGETLVENDETFTVNLSTPAGAVLGDAQGVGTIQNDDTATLSLTDISRAEGDSGTTAFGFTVSLDNPSTAAITVDFTTTDGTAIAGQDYIATSGTVTIAAGDTSATITVAVTGETLVESAETFTVDLSTPTGAVLGDAQGLGTIQNDDTATIGITDVSLPEGNSGNTAFNFTMSVDNPSATDITVDFTTADGTASAGQDYIAATGTVTILAGDTSATITIAGLGELLVESDETFTVDLSNPAGAVFGDTQGAGAIQNDDTATLSITNVSQAEGDSGATAFDFTVSLDNPSATDIMVDFTTADGSATAGADYTATTGTVTIPAGNTSATLTVAGLGELLVESDETFTVDLRNPVGAVLAGGGSVLRGMGTMQNDDTATISITDVSLLEGDSGTTAFGFTVDIDNPSVTAITVDFITTDATALAGADYTATTGTVTIPVGTTSATITVDTLGETVVESNETFTVTRCARGFRSAR